MFTGFLCYHVAFQIVGGILALAPAHLFLQMQLGESWRLGLIFAVTDSGCISSVLEKELFPGPSGWVASVQELEMFLGQGSRRQ